jgi:hypothetical protein
VELLYYVVYGWSLVDHCCISLRIHKHICLYRFWQSSYLYDFKEGEAFFTKETQKDRTKKALFQALKILIKK